MLPADAIDGETFSDSIEEAVHDYREGFRLDFPRPQRSIASRPASLALVERLTHFADRRPRAPKCVAQARARSAWR